MTIACTRLVADVSIRLATRKEDRSHIDSLTFKFISKNELAEYSDKTPHARFPVPLGER